MKDPKTLYTNKKVLILGLGINQGGVGSAKFFINAGAKVRITDLKNKDDLATSLHELEELAGIEYTLGEHQYEDIDWADIIIKNPAIKPDNSYLLHALKHHKHVEMDMGIFLQFTNPAQIIGITGSKGKSTTSTLIYEILKKADKEVVFAGNIGKSVLDTISHVSEKTLVVLEISSFQLEAFDKHKVSPKYAVITNIYQDHLNYYDSMEKYTESKQIIAKYQNQEDFLFIRKDNEVTSKPEFLQDLKGKIIYFSKSDLPENFSPKLPGEHNLENFAAAFAVARIFKIPEQIILEALQNFSGVEYRLQLIKEVNGIKIYNDSTATMPVASIEAIKSLPGSILICGGMNKHLTFDSLAKIIDEKAKMVFFIDGNATDEIKKYLKSQDKIRGTYSDLEKLLTDVKAVAKPGDTILFSPGATSFNFFQNEFDRARKFNAAVEKVFA